MAKSENWIIEMNLSPNNVGKWLETDDGKCRFNRNHEVEPYSDPWNPEHKNLIYCRRCDIIFFNKHEEEENGIHDV